MKNLIPLAGLLLSLAATAADTGRRYDKDNNNYQGTVDDDGVDD